MAKYESKGTGDPGKQRSQVPSSRPTGKPASTAAEVNRGDTGARRTSGPTELPAQFGRYRVLKKLGGGGMGTVYLVENTELEREEALKVPHFTDGNDPELRNVFSARRSRRPSWTTQTCAQSTTRACRTVSTT